MGNIVIRRPLVPVLMIQCLIILVVIKGFGVDLYHTDFEPYYDSVQKIEGRVKSIKIKDGYTALTVDMGWENLLIRLDNVTDESYVYDLVGRRITATGKITEPSARRNPLCFDYRQYLRARHCYAIMDASIFKFTPGKIENIASHFLAGLKCSFTLASKEMMGTDSYGLVAGILFGDKAYLDDDIYEEFQDNGIAHILAVSGLHVGLVYSVVRKVLRRNDILSAIISVIILFVYAALADFSISVIRAGAMICLSILAFHTRKRYDMLSAACAVAIIILAVNPYYVFDSGMQLSFLAAYSLAVILPFCEIRFKAFCDRKRSEKLYKIGSFFLPGLVLQLGMTPLMAYHFLNFSPISLFINPIAIYLASLILPFGLVCFVVHPVKIVFAGFARICQVLCKGLVLLADVSDKICGGLTVPAPPLSLLILYYVMLFYYFSELRIVILRRKREYLSIALGGALALASCLIPFAIGAAQSPLPWKYDSYDAVFVDVGQGDCIHIQSRGVNVLVDGGGSYYKDVAEDILRPYLLRHGITKIDMAIVTHLDSDHSKGIADLSQKMKIGTIVFPVTAAGDDLSGFNCDDMVFVSAGDFISAGEARFDVLSPVMDGGGSGSNESSIVSLCTVNGVRIMLLSDITKEIEQTIDFPAADIVKIGHHGSKTSTSEKMLEQTGATEAVISCGLNNRFGHPHQSVLELLESSGIIVRRTDLEGALLLRGGELGSIR